MRGGCSLLSSEEGSCRRLSGWETVGSGLSCSWRGHQGPMAQTPWQARRACQEVSKWFSEHYHFSFLNSLDFWARVRICIEENGQPPSACFILEFFFQISNSSPPPHFSIDYKNEALFVLREELSCLPSYILHKHPILINPLFTYYFVPQWIPSVLRHKEPEPQ